MVDLSTPEKRASHDLELGRKYPYHGKQPTDWAEAAALAICASLCDRRGIKQEMRDLDQDVTEEIVETFAAIIRVALAQNGSNK
jgi:hypothetical protein